MYTPEDFRSGAPPRIIGTEMEYNIHNKRIGPADMIKQVVRQINPESDPAIYSTTFLKNGAKIYPELAFLTEYATPESLGPRDAVISDLAGQELLRRALLNELQEIGEDPSLIQNGLFRRVGFYALSQPEEWQMTNRPKFQVTGYQESYYTPRWKRPDAAKMFFGSFLATKPIWAGAGMFYDGQYLISQKGLSAGHVEYNKAHGTDGRPLFRRDYANIDERFQRVEVRVVDPNRSPKIEWLGKAGTSLALRYIEHDGDKLHHLSLRDPVKATHEVTTKGNKALLKTIDGKTIRPQEHQAAVFEEAANQLIFVNLPDEEQVALNGLLRITNSQAPMTETGEYPRWDMFTKIFSDDPTSWDTVKAIYYDLSFDNLLKKANSLPQVLKSTAGIPGGITEQQVEQRMYTPPKTRASARAKHMEPIKWHTGASKDPYNTEPIAA